MRNSLPRLTLCLALALGLGACALVPRPKLASTPPDTSKACADWRWIGIGRPGAQCPEVPGWTVRPLFAQLAPAVPEPGCRGEQEVAEKVPSPEVIRELNRFCVYEIADPKKSLKQVPFPPAASADLVRFDQDCAALALTDTDLGAETGIETAGTELLLAQAGRPHTPLEINNRLGVRLAFLDTQPTGEGVPARPGNSLHGYTLAHLARQLVCTPGSADRCAARITTRLALPIIEFDPKHPRRNRIDLERGGYLGMQSDLAEAIRNEVDSWWPKRGSQRHLVLNLSMAWDGELFGGLDERAIADMRAGTQAIYRALQYAAGFDALVLAAAGNQKQAPCVNFGPLLPAAWETGAPREESCREPEAAPLLYAVGGVQADGSPLANARPGGMPRRAAYGETEIFAGSSVATAVASSIAAVVWDTFPDLTSREVMEVLDGAGRHAESLLPLKADFWFGAYPGTAEAAPAVRRLSLCTVLEQACRERPAAACPLRSSCSSLKLKLATLSKPATANTTTRGSCQPWLYPQPEYDPCPTCPPQPKQSP